MTKLLFCVLAAMMIASSMCVPTASTTACSTLSTQPAGNANCGSTAAANCTLWTAASGSTQASPAGVDCINAASGYQVWTADALGDNTGGTSTLVCPTSCANGWCSSSLAAAGTTCLRCATGYGAASSAYSTTTGLPINGTGTTATQGSTNTSSFLTAVACTKCTAVGCDCYGDYPALCRSCPLGYLPPTTTSGATGANTSAAVTDGNSATTQYLWLAGKGPTSCVACNATITNCSVCANASYCSTCASGYKVSSGACVKFSTRVGAAFGLAFVGIVALLF